MRKKFLAILGGVLLAPLAFVSLTQTPAQAVPGWELKWAPNASTDGLAAFELVEDDRADSHPAGQPHIYTEGNNFRWNMHMVDRDTMTDRQRQEVAGMRTPAGGPYLQMLPGQSWRFTYSMFIPSTLKGTTTFTHIMQFKMPGTGSLPIMTISLDRDSSNQQIIEMQDFNENNLIIGSTPLVPLQNSWIDVEVETKIGDGTAGSLRFVIKKAGTTILDQTKTGIDTFLDDRVRPKWGIYRSLGDTSGSLQDTYMLITNMRGYQWTNNATPSPSPSPSPTPTPSNRYEAETATISQGTVASDHLGYSGTGFVDYTNVAGSYVQWAVNAPTAGQYNIKLRYANGTTVDRPEDVTVNGNLVANDLSFPPTANWDTWATKTITATLNAGTNLIRATGVTANGGPNTDYIEVDPAPAAVDYQAENATISQGVVESNHLGYTGTGFVNFTNIAGSYLQQAVSSTTARATSLTIRYSNGTTVNRPMDITVNGVLVANDLSFPPTADWDTWATKTITATLNAGSNTIKLTSSTADGGPNIDKLTIG
ncbi:carbohydrate-binding protein [Planotetraspora sp. A-T 1434]|uniref:CBM35 domain-containing protein n=1 Tax=Planotetraspora sp. A-T 1434 TaxID=2979219 RepID=UPI0021BEF512|nr:CBM35 domain-containing protein [Planotetraspora sp. A-T 1434]MCT9930252.1 carbohydrate-binding protein [Planotetraspora sp. A-T 1434]